jgi:hypothetical protein
MSGKPFEIGNKLGKGRPPGSRNKKTRFLQSLQIHGDAIIDKAKLMALSGDRTAMRLCMERLIPVPKAPESRFRLPNEMKTPADLMNVLPSVIKETSKGHLSASEAESIARVVDTHLHTMDRGEFDERIRALEGNDRHVKPDEPDEEEK